MNSKRLLHGLLWGVILGVVCVLGAVLRIEEPLGFDYVFAYWYNRVLMGLVIGLFPVWGLKKSIIRGAVIGLLVSFAFFSATSYQDWIGFLFGAIYGMIVEYSLFKAN